MALLFSNRYASLDLDQSVVRYVRNSEPFATVEDLRQSHGDISRALDRLGRARYALLVDLREARGANSGAMDQAMAQERRRLLSGFSRVSLLVKSAAGLLQVQRNLRDDGIAGRVFLDDERAALAFARGAGPVTVDAPMSERAPLSVRPPSSRTPPSIDAAPRSVRPDSSPSSGPSSIDRVRPSERFGR